MILSSQLQALELLVDSDLHVHTPVQGLLQFRQDSMNLSFFGYRCDQGFHIPALT